ncbi:DUF397 domain-containing protein [Actinoplanes rectilineatus]|uniref:DUF397 domain-containing protein n=1 Tax=Actinoplanes rectilineatus TaxID=113571 RepID=UPI0009F8610B|nr:DUF397 domain-containing protein [Actinoplanes rectilineatus]
MNPEPENFNRRLLEWKKSSRSGGSGGNCVEVARIAESGWAVRDSKNPDGPVLRFTLAEWDAFVHGVKDGEFED